MSGEEGIAILFYANQRVKYLFYVLGCLWLTVMIILMFFHLYRYLKWREVCMGNIPEEDMKIQAVFDAICE